MMNMKKSGPDKEPHYITTNRCHTCKHGIINYATLATGRQCNHPLGSMPRLSSSRRKSLFIHPERLSSPSSFMAMLKRSNKSASRRSCTENRSFLLSLVDNVYPQYNNGLKVTMYTNDTIKAKPRTPGAVTGLLTTNTISVRMTA